MKKYVKTRISLLLFFSFICILFIHPVQNAVVAETDGASDISGFVERMYSTCLERESDSRGLAWWTNEVQEGRNTGAGLAEAFALSEEMVSRDLSNEEYITILYAALMGRQPDEGGLNFWLGYMKNGISRKGILHRFISAPEYQKICDKYGINRGNSSALEPRDIHPHLTFFLMEQYRIILGRDGDSAGMNAWIQRIINKESTIEQVSGRLLFSEESAASGNENEDFVKKLYRIFMRREADSGGLAHWSRLLAEEKVSRNSLFEDFAYGEDFKEILKNAGIEPSAKPKPVQVRAAVQVVLTFDDGPGAYTNRVLDILAEKGVKATFFVQGVQAQSRPAEIKRMVDEGHIVANHTYNHADLARASQATRESQLSRTDDILRSLGAPTPPYMRPPGGSYNSAVCATAGRPVILWDVDPRDWEVRNTNAVVSRVLNGARDGSIILLHDVHVTTVNGVAAIIDEFHRRGVQIIPLDEMLTRDGNVPVAGRVYSSGR